MKYHPLRYFHAAEQHHLDCRLKEDRRMHLYYHHQSHRSLKIKQKHR